MRVSSIRWVIGLVSVCIYAWLALAQPLVARAAAPICIDPKTKKEIPCPATAIPAGGGNGQPGTETNGRICVAAFNDLNLNGLQDAGEAFLSGGQVQITNQASGAITLADLLDTGPNCQFLPGGTDYASAETPPAGFSIIGTDTFNAHLDADGTVQILFANTNSIPAASPTVKVVAKTATKFKTLTPPSTTTPTATPSATTPLATATATATATASPSPTLSPTPIGPAVGIVGNSAPAVQPTQPPPPVPTNDPQPVGACSPWLIGAGLGLLTTGVSLAGLARQVRRSRAAPLAVPDADNPPPAPDDGFGYGPSQSQQRTLNSAFTSKGSQRPNDRLANAGPTPGGVDGSAYQLSLAGLPKRASRFSTGLGVALLVALAVGGVVLAGIGAAGVAGGAACGQWPLGAVAGVIVLGMTAALLGVVDTQLKYTLFLPEGTPDRATVSLKMKQPAGPAGPKLADQSGHQSTGNTGITSKYTQKSDGDNSSSDDPGRH